MEKGDLNSIQVMQNKAARIAAAMPFRSNQTIAFDKLGWLTVQQLVNFHAPFFSKLGFSNATTRRGFTFKLDHKTSTVIFNL